MRFVHEFEEFVDNSLQELPMRLEETGILTNNVHDVGCNDSLVIFSSFHLSQPEKILDDSNKETLLSFLA